MYRLEHTVDSGLDYQKQFITRLVTFRYTVDSGIGLSITIRLSLTRENVFHESTFRPFPTCVEHTNPHCLQSSKGCRKGVSGELGGLLLSPLWRGAFLRRYGSQGCGRLGGSDVSGERVWLLVDRGGDLCLVSAIATDVWLALQMTSSSIFERREGVQFPNFLFLSFFFFFLNILPGVIGRPVAFGSFSERARCISMSRTSSATWRYI
jgi:hypothetical protein